MAESKNQHYVPRHYLRRFAFPDGKRILTYLIKSESFPPPAPIKTQCSKPYFYGKDTRFEKILTELEGRAETFFSTICQTDSLPRDLPTKRDILAVLGIMHGRTRLSVQQRDSLFDQGMKAAIRKHPEFESMTSISKDDLDKFTFTDRFSSQRAVITAVLTGYVIGDLALKLLKSGTNRHFITSDHPVVVVNQAFTGVVTGVNACGLSLRGIQLLLPLDPLRCLFAFDPNTYRVGTASRDYVKITREEDIDIINSLQLQNANEHLYFQDPTDCTQIRQLVNKFGGFRGRAGGFARSVNPSRANATAPSFVTFEMPQVKIPASWSFCHIRKGVSARGLGLRNPELNSQLDAYHRDIVEKQRLVTFHTWLSEQRILGA